MKYQQSEEQSTLELILFHCIHTICVLNVVTMNDIVIFVLYTKFKVISCD